LGLLAMMTIMGAEAQAQQECIMKGAAVGEGYDLKEGNRVYNVYPDSVGGELYILENGRFLRGFFLQEVNEKGPLPQDSESLAEDQSSRVIEAKIEAIKAQQSARSAQGKEVAAAFADR
jgi:hypothetical protein